MAFGGGPARAPKRARHLPFHAFGIGDAHGIQAVLCAQLVHQVGSCHAHAVDAPSRVATGQQLVKHHGLVGAVESA